MAVTTWQQIHASHRAAVEGMFAQCEVELRAISELCLTALRGHKKLLFCGNGGSACDAMHIAGEFVGRFMEERAALAAIALSADSGIITAVANDYGYEEVFARQVNALGEEGDILIALSTSGTSANVVKALAAARAKRLKTVLMTGEKGKDQKAIADIVLVVPAAHTAHVQEAHMVALHGVATVVEQGLFGK